MIRVILTDFQGDSISAITSSLRQNGGVNEKEVEEWMVKGKSSKVGRLLCKQNTKHRGHDAFLFVFSALRSRSTAHHPSSHNTSGLHCLSICQQSISLFGV